MTSTMFFQNIINGLISGSYYAVLGVGLTITWGVLKMINVAHGDFYMLGAYFFYTFSKLMGMPVVPSIIIAVGGVFLVGMAVEKSILSPTLERAKFGDAPFILTLAVGILLQNIAKLVWGEKYVGVPYFNDGIIEVMGITMAVQRLIVAGVAMTTLILVMFLIKRTKFGWAISATAQNKFSAALMGINTKQIYMVTFGIAVSMCAISGTLLAPIYGLNPWMSASVQLKSFVVCIVGGLGSVGGGIIAGLLLGLIESFAVQFLGSGWQNVVAYSVVILMFWVRPTGLFGKKEW